MENQKTRSKSLFDPPVTSFGGAKKNGEEERASEKLGREEREETRYISTGGGGGGAINCQNNCRHEESFRCTTLGTLFTVDTATGGMYVPVDTRDIIYGDSYRPRRRILPPT